MGARQLHKTQRLHKDYNYRKTLTSVLFFWSNAVQLSSSIALYHNSKLHRCGNSAPLILISKPVSEANATLWVTLCG